MILRKLVLFALLALFAVGAAAVPGTASEPATKLKGRVEAEAPGLIAAGAAAIPFRLQDLDGQVASLDGYRGKKTVLLVFWSFFCGPCREEIPLLDAIGKRYADRGFDILAINLDGPKLEKAVRKYVSSNDFTFRVLWEQVEGIRYVTADAYGVAGTPTLVLIGKDGKVVWSHVGREEPARIEEVLGKALAP